MQYTSCVCFFHAGWNLLRWRCLLRCAVVSPQRDKLYTKYVMHVCAIIASSVAYSTILCYKLLPCVRLDLPRARSGRTRRRTRIPLIASLGTSDGCAMLGDICLHSSSSVLSARFQASTHQFLVLQAKKSFACCAIHIHIIPLNYTLSLCAFRDQESFLPGQFPPVHAERSQGCKVVCPNPDPDSWPRYTKALAA